MPAESRPPRRASRVRLYLPLVLLALLAIGWSAGWFVIRARTLAGMDAWLASEAASGRQWTCRDRNAGGYPFRIEISCGSLSFERADLTASLGRVLAVSQVYRPGHIIIEAQGPLRVAAAPSTNVEAEWRLLQASVIFGAGNFQRLALVAEDPRLRGASPETGPLDLAARRFEAHARPDPADATTADLAFSTEGAVLPGLDALVGGNEPADLDLVLRLTRAVDLPTRLVASELEGWRLAGGRLQIDRVRLVKGPRRVELQGSAALDEMHRPRAELQGQVAGVEGLLGPFLGDRSGLAGNLLGALLGQPPAAATAQPLDPKAPRMKPLPPLRVENGRLFVGPLQIPNVRIPALY
ncbi:DUF2125 domain-containing protein [Enterovirga aerilata]|uniref:DUF2125 domain-containing protein n=1 Tax=Enterovirga aerilata TaxID=2730920 RepID=A0A849I4V9_9HYPH|nr:DUF2125 domain-containing protein [Enterovirga sp. DB1703]